MVFRGSPFHRLFRGSTWLLVPLLALALFVRLLAWPYQAIVSVDGTNYIRLARYIAGGPPHATAQPPGYPLLIALFQSVAPGDGVTAARLAALVCGLALLVPFFLLARRLFGPVAAAGLGLVLALTPLAIRYSVTTMSESPYILLALLAALAFHHKRHLLAGILAGAAFLVRPEGLVLAGVLALLRIRTRAAAPLIVVGFLLAGAGPALLFNHHATGEWTLTRKTGNLRSDNFWDNEVTVASTLGKKPGLSLTERLRENAGTIRRTFPRNFRKEAFNLAGAVGWPLTLVILPGLLVGPPVAGAGLAQALVVPLFPGLPTVPRFVLPLVPFALLLGAGMVHRLVAGSAPLVPRPSPPAGRTTRERPERTRSAPRRKLETGAGWVLAAVLLTGWLVPILGTWKSLKEQEDGFFPELVEAGLAIRPFVKPDDIVFDRKPYVAFYAGARHQSTPLGGYTETLNAVSAAGGDYLVVDEAVALVFRPALLPLVMDSFPMLNDPRLDLICLSLRYEGHRAAVYRILRPGDSRIRNASMDRLRAAVKKQIPHDPRLHAFHGRILELDQRPLEAVKEYELALAMNPADTAAAARLTALRQAEQKNPAAQTTPQP